MARKVDQDVLERIRILKVRDGLTHELIARRLGLGLRTVRQYVSQLRAAGQVPQLATSTDDESCTTLQ